MTVILFGHILSKIQIVADHAGMISNGILGYEGPLKAGENPEALFMNTVGGNGRTVKHHD